MPDTAGVSIYECADCGERLLDRRCPDCNRFTRRLGTGGNCPCCGETITIDELETINN